MNQRDQEEKKLRQEQKQGEKRQEVEQTSWLNSIMKSAAVTLERVQRRTRAFFSQGGTEAAGGSVLCRGGGGNSNGEPRFG